MNELQIFNNEDFEVRTSLVDNEPYFMLGDVCRILGIKNTSDAKARLDIDGVVTTEGVDSLNRKNEMTFINESNLYKLVFQSRKPQAEKFSKWVTSEVLPTIRKNGMYATDELLDNPDLLIKVATQLKDEREKRKLLESKIEADKPKVLFAECVEASKDTIAVSDLATILKQNGIDIGRNKLFAYLRETGYLIKVGKSKNLPTQRALDMKLFETVESTHTKPNGEIFLKQTTRITGKGQKYFVDRFLKKEKN